MRRYGRARARRRRWVGLVAVVVLAGLVLWLWASLEPERRVQEAVYPLRYEETIRAAGELYGVDPALIAGIIYVESRFNPEAVSPRGAYGMMQIMPDTAVFISERSGIGGDFRDPHVNIRMGTWYYTYLERKYQGDERLVLAAYNAGEGRVDAWLRREGFDIERDIPYIETRNYVEDVAEARDRYAELYGDRLR
ncbi:lytic transglycosylase domain-containing protein [Rubrobacter taiwanensis]|jgi:soluble lytic murein transglycosylase|uniref:Lytic transglycosylase domain-containing protein n=1 Tax=Rubrobacter taiwanensis TaxID=185139 RepID=A0A4R1BPF4_9ACTN|nr:lytic transglycosylase domain-containing protein [Rubrobacter taiwanensis]TCJ19484.1 lytic transglycosylase domain-containing protein [Rubrobacter taiwanensis]